MGGGTEELVSQSHQRCLSINCLDNGVANRLGRKMAQNVLIVDLLNEGRSWQFDPVLVQQAVVTRSCVVSSG